MSKRSGRHPVLVTWQPNWIDPDSAVTTRERFRPGAGVLDYCPASLPETDNGLELVCAVNGRGLTPMEQVACQVRPGDSILWRVRPLGGGDDGGKNIIGTVASIAMMVAAPHIASTLLGPMNYYNMGVATFGVSMMGKIATGAIALGGMMLVNSVLPQTRPDTGPLALGGAEPLSASPTYGWNAEDNPTRNGSPVAVAYGRIPNVVPFFLSRYVSTDGDKQYLNLLYLLGEGPLDETDGVSDIEINDNPIGNYDDVEWEWRQGLLDQDVIPWFNDAINERGVSVKLSTDWHTVTCEGTVIQSLGVGVSAPGGLWYANDGGTLDTVSVSVEIESRPEGGAWTSWGSLTVSGSTREALRRYERRNGLAASRHEVRVRLAAEPPSGPRYSSDVYWEYLHEIVPDDFALPHSALLAIRALATDQLSGGRPRVTCTLKRSTVQVYDPDAADGAGAWDTRPASNPAWMAYDMARHPRYGAGFALERLILADFENAADWCVQKGITGAFYLDSAMDVQSFWDHCGLFGRFRVVQKGTRFGTIVDRPCAMPDQGFLVTASNTLSGSFGIEYTESKDRADAVEVTYFDDDKGRTTIKVLGEHYRTITGRQPNVGRITLYPCRSRDLAYKAGVYYLRCNRYLGKKISMALSADALGVVPGKIMQVAHEVMGWGESRRVVSATSMSVQLDAEVELLAGEQYRVWVRHTDQINEDGSSKAEQLDLAPVAEDTVTDSVTLDEGLSFDSVPSAGAVVAVGAVGRSVQLYRVERITRSTRSRRTVEAMEYHEAVYADEGEVPAVDTRPMLAAVAGLQAGIFERTEDGVAKRVISLFWRGAALRWWIFCRAGASGPWRLLGTATDAAFDARNLAVGTIYNFVVSATQHPGDGETVQVDFTDGASGLVQDVTVVSDFRGLEPVTVTVGGLEQPVQVVI